jgi:hypothetical protein
MIWLTVDWRRLFAAIAPVFTFAPAFALALAFPLALAFVGPASAQEYRSAYTPAAADTIHSIAAEHGMVVGQEKISARIGADILKQGGNAVDAAVATGQEISAAADLW